MQVVKRLIDFKFDEHLIVLFVHVKLVCMQYLIVVQIYITTSFFSNFICNDCSSYVEFFSTDQIENKQIASLSVLIATPCDAYWLRLIFVITNESYVSTNLNI